MRYFRITSAGLMAVVAGFYFGLVLSRYQTPPKPKVIIAPNPNLDCNVAHEFSMIYSGQLEEARSKLQTAIKYNPFCINAYVGLATIAVREGNDVEAIHQYDCAIKKAGSSQVWVDHIARLCNLRALSSLTLSRRDAPKAWGDHCQEALTALAKGFKRARSNNTYTLACLETTAAQVELRMAEIADLNGDGVEAMFHRENAANHARSAMTLRPRLKELAQLLKEHGPQLGF